MKSTQSIQNVQVKENRLLSVVLDGKASIEHQLNLYVADLASLNPHHDSSKGGTTKTSFGLSLTDVLNGIDYVISTRIKGGQMPHLDAELMARLMEALLQRMGDREGVLLTTRPTQEADVAMRLFGELLVDVAEFREAVGKKSASDLRHSMKLHRRADAGSSSEQRTNAATLALLLSKLFPQFNDPRELVKDDEWDLLAKYAPPGDVVSMPESTREAFPPPQLWFDKTCDRLLSMFKTDIEAGLSSDRVVQLREHYGYNDLPEPPKPLVIKMILTQFLDFMMLILLAAAIITAAIGEGKSSVTLGIVIVLNAVIGFTQEYKANKALEALKSLNVTMATVLRDGVTVKIPSRELVPGDTVILDEGDAIPADLRIAEASQLYLIESILTGESVPVVKSTDAIRVPVRNLPLGDCRGNAFMSTMVARGRGKGIVVRTGLFTEIGKISAALTTNKTEVTPIQRKLAKLGVLLVILAVLLCVLVVIIGVAWRHPAGEMVKIGVALAVSVIPEGLVAVVTVTMALGVHRMAQRNAIVRKLPSVETLGSVTFICSDKTGTLTEGKMGALKLWTTDKQEFTFTHCTSYDTSVGELYASCQSVPKDSSPGNLGNELSSTVKSFKEVLSLGPKISKDPVQVSGYLTSALMVACCCNNASVHLDEGVWKPSGDPTEVAMVTAAGRAGFGKELFVNQFNFSKIGEYPFDSDRKLMSVLYSVPICEKLRVDAETTVVFAKGAPEALLGRCANATGSAVRPTLGQLLKGEHCVQLDPALLESIMLQSASMASEGLRVLAFAYRVLSGPQEAADLLAAERDELVEKDLTFCGLIGLVDPPKKGVREAVESCALAGIKVVMITGDHVNTATAIAQQLSILDPRVRNKSCAMRGSELDMLSEEQLSELNPFPVVFARVSPENKLKIVKALQSHRHLVAMTGDGVNDAPAIKKADVGVAMGIGGTEITKQAADIVLADDNFTTIVEAVKEGRKVFDNIQKFIVYLLSCNMAEIILMLLCAIINVDTPLSSINILWANIIADIPPAMSLGIEPLEPRVMSRKPRNPRAPVLSLPSIVVILGQGLIISLISFAVYLLVRNVPGLDITTPDSTNPLAQQRTLTFITLTTIQLVQSFYSRSVFDSVFSINFFTNKWLLGAFVLSFGLMTLGIYCPGLNDFLEFEPMKKGGWAIVAVCLVIQFVFVEMLKLVSRSWVAKRERDKEAFQLKLETDSAARLAYELKILRKEERSKRVSNFFDISRLWKKDKQKSVD